MILFPSCRRSISAIAAVSVLGTLAGSVPPAYAQETASVSTGVQSSLLITGTGEVKVKPDIVYISLAVYSQDAQAASAARQNAMKTNAVIKALIKGGIAVADIHTEDYLLEAHYVEKKGATVFMGYRVSNSVRVVVRKIASAGKAIDTCLSAGANSVSDITFALADPEKAQDAARAKAIVDATRKAKLAAKAANLGSICLIELLVDTDSEDGGQFYQYRSRKSFAARALAVATPIQSGLQTITATVTARYGIIAPTPVLTTLRTD